VTTVSTPIGRRVFSLRIVHDFVRGRRRSARLGKFKPGCAPDMSGGHH
jgi:hypothetical protein